MPPLCAHVRLAASSTRLDDDVSPLPTRAFRRCPRWAQLVFTTTMPPTPLGGIQGGHSFGDARGVWQDLLGASPRGGITLLEGSPRVLGPPSFAVADCGTQRPCSSSTTIGEAPTALESRIRTVEPPERKGRPLLKPIATCPLARTCSTVGSQ